MITNENGQTEVFAHRFSICMCSSKYVCIKCSDNEESVEFCRLLFKKIAKVLGGRMRELMTGGAPLAPETQEFIKLCLCCRITQGYGLTESTAGATTMDG